MGTGRGDERCDNTNMLTQNDVEGLGTMTNPSNVDPDRTAPVVPQKRAAHGYPCHLASDRFCTRKSVRRQSACDVEGAMCIHWQQASSAVYTQHGCINGGVLHARRGVRVRVLPMDAANPRGPDTVSVCGRPMGRHTYQ